MSYNVEGCQMMSNNVEKCRIMLNNDEFSQISDLFIKKLKAIEWYQMSSNDVKCGQMRSNEVK